MKMVTVRNGGDAPAMVRGLLLLEDETVQVAAGLVAGLQSEYPQLVVVGGEAAVEPVEPGEEVPDEATEDVVVAKPKAKKK